MKPYYQYTNEERVNLTNEELNDAIRLEAIERKIPVPISLPEHLRNTEYRGFKAPAKYVKVFVAKSGHWGDGIAYLDEAKAIAALDGCVRLGTTYPKGSSIPVPCLEKTEVRVEQVFVSQENFSITKPINPYEEPEEADKAFKELAEECMNDFNFLRQAAYDQGVRQVKRKEYLRLANNNEEIARAFWEKVERGTWPSEITNA